jgi:hypothetical protein
MHSYTEFSPQVIYLPVYNEPKKFKISLGLEVFCIATGETRLLEELLESSTHY